MSNSTLSSVVEPPDSSGSPAAVLITCQNCGSHLPIRTAVWKELPALWRCSRCGSHHCGVLPPEGREQMLSSVALAVQYFDCQPALLQHEWADALIEHLHHQELHTAITDKRTSPRVARNLHAQVIAVDESWAPRGRSFPVIIYNISTGGLAYIAATINRAPLTAIQLAGGHTLQVVAKSVWARPEHGGLFSVGVKFLCRLGAGSA
ncbi:MAG: PilZ domain-containing protein [Pirellulales bacterium]